MSHANYRFFHDSEHGWLEVPHSEVKASGINVTSHSYYDPQTDMAYLEEDVDMPNYMKATGLGRENLIDHPITIGRSDIRLLPPYEAK